MKSARFQHTGSMMGIGLFIGLCAWFIEAAVHSIVLRDGPFAVQFFSPSRHDVWTRFLIGFALIILAANARFLLAGRRGAERAFRELGDKYRNIFENIGDGILIADKKTRKIVEVNRAMCDILGYRRDEILGLSLDDIRSPGDLPSVPEQSGRTAHNADGEIRSEARVRRKDGTVFHADIGHATVSLNGVLCAVEIVRDITEKKMLDDLIRISNEELKRQILESTIALEDAGILLNRKIIEHMLSHETLKILLKAVESLPIGITIADADNRILYVNPADAKMHGYYVSDLIGRNTAVYAAAGAREDKTFEQIHRLGVWTRESVNLRENGEPFPVHLTSVTIKHPEGTSPCIITLCEDITERKNAEFALVRHAEQLRTLSSRLIEAREEERKYIARELHDEIGQQLTALKLSLDMMQLMVPAAQAGKLRDAQALAAGLLEQVRNLSLDLRPTMLDDFGLLPALKWHFDRYRSRTGIRVAFHQRGVKQRFEPRIETAIYRVIQESLTNVARHARVTEAAVSLVMRGGSLSLIVADRGAGFDPGGIDRRTAGLLGMQERIATLGGRMTIQSKPGDGVLVTATVPLERMSAGRLPCRS